MGLSGREEEAAKVEGAPPPKPNPNWEGGAAPVSFLPLSSFLPLLLLLGKGVILLPVVVGLP